ncbi:CUE domain-containing protein 2-like [Pomacea canaliculata]|nr:CUE domain-containing protein 2-like [Pomacea canaliculata]XP_025098068.1 CUE domain-containing protein 2-like [Pomacea canaliculata]
MELNDKEQIVKSELEAFLVRHSLGDAIRSIDEIVLNYVLGILEDLGSYQSMEDTEDVELFAEMMEAYLPGFSAVSIPEVCQWMFNIAEKLSTVQKSAFSSTTEKDENAEERKPNLTTAKVKMKSSFQQSGQHNHPPLSTGKDRCHDGQDMLNVNLEMDQNQLSLLRELCPGASQAELECCFHLAGGNLEEAAQVLLYRQETGTAISATASQPRKKSCSGVSHGCHNDESLKDNILAKYSFVDTNEDKRTHKPALLTKEEKKLVRYRDGQVVSTKGERFSEVKRQESEDMKKTYVSLKPAQKYRFH